MSSVSTTTSTEKRLFWASFITLIAAGIGFSIRASILKDWAAQFGFTQGELGNITGGGLVGFGLTIIVLSFIADKVGYGKLMALAFVLHLSSVIVTVAATPVFNSMGRDAAYQCLWWGCFLFALGNGACEAVINPLTATLFPKEKTHWLNILHAGWPGGLILGALLAVLFAKINENGKVIGWEIQIATYGIPVLIYGILMAGQKFPKSEASSAGVSIGTMLKEVLAPVLLMLLVLHALVGYVELGTDSWIANITGSIMESPTNGLLLFIWTSGLMFILRFFAGPIVHRISPLGLLFVSGVLGAVGLMLLGLSQSVTMCIIAATVYGFGKTFLWPTMLGVVSERFPRGGAVTLGLVGGVGMLSAGLLGGPGIGYKQDYFATLNLKDHSPPTYVRYKVEEPKGFLFFPKIAGLDGQKVATLNDNGKQLKIDQDLLEGKTRKESEERELKNLKKLSAWWDEAKTKAAEDKPMVTAASLYGGKMALRWTAAVPAAMAVGYLILIVYFQAIGGYKPATVAEEQAHDHH
ncbi:MAG: Major Facilitator Superfamily protein [Planctomycetaceae bacterium]|nr:Major Facilitator Superfamily protein [Planctomycetaceae bacterium]